MRKLLEELEMRKKGTSKIYNPGLDRPGVTHFLTLRDLVWVAAQTLENTVL